MNYQWTRRGLLAGLVSGIAGCSSFTSDSGESSTPTSADTPLPSPTPTATSSPTPTLTESPTQTPAQSPTPSVEVRTFSDSYYQGPLVSAHEHMTGPDGYTQEAQELNRFARLMDRNNIARAAAFAPPGNLPYVDDFSDRLIPFLFPRTFLREHPDEFATRIKRYTRGMSSVRGLGEFGLYGVTNEEGLPLPPDSEQMLEIYDFAAQQGIPVMVDAAKPYHFPDSVRNSWESDLECPTIDQMANAYEHNRETKFIVHATYFGAEDVSRAEMVAQALSNHPNLYYDLSPISPYAYFNGLLGSGSMTRDKFQSKMDATGIEHHVNNYYEVFKPLLENHSKRVLWGIDAAYEWHYTEWAMDTWVDIGRALLGRLPEENARNVGYRTAEELFDIEVAS